MSGIEGKVVAITGASSGIGEATARLLASRGARIVVGARREGPLRALAEEIGGAYAVTDVAKREDLARLVGMARERFGRLDVFVGNAGIARNARIDALNVEDWDAMIDTNLRGVLYGVAAAVPVFREQGGGHLVNTISTSGLKIVPTQGVYAATKNAVRTLMEALRQENVPGLRITNVSPGFVRTSIADGIPEGEAKEEVLRRMESMAIPPEAIARSIAFAIEQPDDVEVGDLVIRPTVQG